MKISYTSNRLAAALQAVCAIAALSVVAPAHAAIITWQFEGVVGSVFGKSTLLSPSIGERFVATYELSDVPRPQLPGDHEVRYDVVGASVTVGSQTIELFNRNDPPNGLDLPRHSGSVAIENDVYYPDYFPNAAYQDQVVINASLQPTTVSVISLGILMNSHAGLYPPTALDSTAVTATAPDPGTFQTRSMWLQIDQADLSRDGLRISAVMPVPLPASCWLLLSGLGALARRRSTQAASC